MATHFASDRRPANNLIPKVDAPVTSSAPEPLPLTAEQTGSFATLSSGQGAVTANRGNAADVAEVSRASRRAKASSSRKLSQAARRNVAGHDTQIKTNRKLFVGLGVAAALVMLVLGFLGWRALASLSGEIGVTEDAGRVERTEVDPQAESQGIEYDGYLYSTRESGGSYSFVRTTEDGADPLELFKLSGTPVSIVLYDGAFVVAENTASGWDVIAYMLGDGSVASELVGPDGSPVAGEGTLASATLEGDDLVLVTEDGSKTSVPLR